MSRRALTTYLSAVVLAFGTVPALAQDTPQDKGQRPNSSGSSQGSAVPRPSGGSSSGGSSTSSGSAESSSSGSSGVSRPSAGSPGGYRAPARPERRTDRAVPRDDSPRSGEQRRVSPGSSSVSGEDASNERRRAVPAYARPRAGRAPIGTAVSRPPSRIGAGNSSYDPYYRFSNYYNRYPYGYYYAGYGLGLGYFYDPMMWGYYSPYGYGGYDPYYGGGGYSQYSRDRYRDVGALRLKVRPEHGQVYVDGYYVGEVDSYDGIFQKLTIEAGTHRVEIRAPGYETVQFEVMVIPGETVTYKGEMTRIQ